MSNLGDVLRQVVCIPSHIPDDWSFQKLTNVCSPKQWRTVSSSEMTETGYPVFGANGFVGFYPEYNHADETIAITCRGNTCGTINRIPPKTYITGNSMALDNVQSNVISQNYLYYALKYRGVGDSISGSAQPQITGAGLRAIEFPAPPLPEQQKIAAILSSVDDVIEKTRAQIDKLKDLKTGMMQELLTKGIGSGGVPHTEFKDSPVGRIPRTWKYALLESVATIQTGIAKNGKAQGDMIEVPYLRVANVQDGYLDLSEIKSIRVERGRLERFSLKDEDVLVNEGGDFDKLGRGAIWDNQISPCVHQNHVFVVRTDKSCLLPKFFNYLSGSQYGKKYYLGCAKQTTNLASLNSSQLKAFPVLLPPVDEQAAICDLLDSMDKKITLSEKKKSAAEALKRALMQDLLTGKVRVNGCDNESAVA